MTDQAPDPERNRREWLAAHPQAGEVSPEEASAQVAAQLGGAAPDPGVSGEALGEQLARAGATAGVTPRDGTLPHEDTVEAELNRLRAVVEGLGTQLQQVQTERQQERATAIAAMGEPILQRYANGIEAHLQAHEAASPALGMEHFKQVRGAAKQLTGATATAISEGANDMGRVRYHAAQIDRFLTRTHRRTAPAHAVHIDMSAVEQMLEYLLDEADRLAPSLPGLLAHAGA
jgi:hypothetical protein